MSKYLDIVLSPNELKARRTIENEHTGCLLSVCYLRGIYVLFAAACAITPVLHRRCYLQWW